MRRLINITTAALLLAVGTAACGSSNDTTSSTAAAPSTEARTTEPDAPDTSTSDTIAPVLSLTDRLLEPTQLGTGWTVEYSDPNEVLGSFGDAACPGHSVAPDVVERVRPTIAAYYTSPDGDSLGFEEAMFEADPTQAAADLDLVFAIDAQCLGVESMQEDGNKLVVEKFDIPTLGDQQEAGTITITAAPDFKAAMVGHIVIVRVGSLVLELVQTETLSEPGASPTYTTAQFIDAVKAAVAKARG